MRHRNWDLRLVSWERTVVGRDFVWGETDCASLVIGALSAMYPGDAVSLPDDVPPYEGEEAARETFEATGGVKAVLEEHGAQTVDLAFAQSGDVLIGLDEQGGMPGAAVVVNDGFVVASEDRGVERRSLAALRRMEPDDVTVWRPPHE